MMKNQFGKETQTLLKIENILAIANLMKLLFFDTHIKNQIVLLIVMSTYSV